MALKLNKDLKMYYSIGEVAEMFDVNESLLRYWEKEFPTMISPKKGGGKVYHLVKECGMTLDGAKKRLKVSKEATVNQAEVIDRLVAVKEELEAMRKELDYLT